MQTELLLFHQERFNWLEFHYFFREKFTNFPLDIHIIPEYFHSGILYTMHCTA